MGLLDTINNKLTGIQTNPLKMGLLAYGMTGQGNNPAGAAMSAMMQASQAKAKQDDLARQKAQQAQIAGMFASGGVDPATLAQYSMGGGDGAKELLDLYKFGRTPQSVAPGQMMIDPTTGKMSMPAPKMGEGQMWDGQQVTSAPGYLQSYGAQKAVDARNAVDQYAAQQGIGYQYDLGRMGQQNRYDLGKLEATQGYDWQKMQAQNQHDYGMAGYQSGLRTAEDKAKQAYGASLDPIQTYDPNTGLQVYNNRKNVAGGGYIAAKPESGVVMDKARAERMAKAEAGMLDAGQQAAALQGNLNQLRNLSDKISTGSMQNWIDGARNIGAQIGLDVGNLADNQVAEGIIARMVATLPKNGGDMSNFELQQRLQQLPQMSNTKEGFAKSIDLLNQYADMQQMVATEIQQQGGLTPELEKQIRELYSSWGK